MLFSGRLLVVSSAFPSERLLVFVSRDESFARVLMPGATEALRVLRRLSKNQAKQPAVLLVISGAVSERESSLVVT